MNPSVTAQHLTKEYTVGKTRITAVNDLSFEVKEGELFGVIGPDGAGKTSLFRMLVSLLLPDKGTATVDGCEVVSGYRELRNRVGYMPGRFSLYPDLTVEENLQFFATIFQTSIEENYHLIKDIYVQIEPFRHRRAGKLSGGMKQKLALCCALIHKPSVLFLDEPTTGVDAVSRTEFWQMLKRLKENNITIMVSTPYMDEAALCDRVALMQEGKFLTSGTPSAITGRFGQDILAVKSSGMYHLIEILKEAPGVDDAYSFGEYAHAVMKAGYDTAALQQYLAGKGQQEVVINPAEANIEDCFLKLMR